MKSRSGLRSRRHPPRAARPLVETLDGRVVLTLLEVVPFYGANGLNSFTTLQAAVTAAHAGDVIQIEPDSDPGNATIALAGNLVIQGDPTYGGAHGLGDSGTEVGTITLYSSNVTITNLYLKDLTINTGVAGTTLSDSIVAEGGLVTQTQGTGTNGANTILGNTFLSGAQLQLGNTAGSSVATASDDQVVDNTFQFDGNTTQISLTNETTGMLFSGNMVSAPSPSGGLPAVAFDDCAGTITGNTIHSRSGGSAITIEDEPGTTRSTDLVVTNNVVHDFTALVTEHDSSANTFTVVVTNNDFAGNVFGMQVLGNNAGTSSDFGSVTVTGNDFSGDSPAISAQDSSTLPTIDAEGNIFSVAHPATVVTPAAQIDVSHPLTGGAANLTSMFLALGEGAPTAAQHSAFDAAPALEQAAVAVRSPMNLKTVVDGLYVSLLGRLPGPGEDQGGINALAHGMTEEQLIDVFVTSPEYVTRVTQGSDYPQGAWVRSLYVNLLGRQPAGSEVTTWLGLLPTIGMSGMAAAFTGSQEFRSNEVEAFYGANTVGFMMMPDILHRTTLATSAEVSGWVNSGLDLLSIEVGFLSVTATH